MVVKNEVIDSRYNRQINLLNQFGLHRSASNYLNFSINVAFPMMA